MGIKDQLRASLAEIGLSAEQHAVRRTGIGASDANIIMGGDPERICQLWREKRGEADPEDLSGVLPVVMGQWTEELNRRWFTMQTGRAVTDAGIRLVHRQYKFIACSLDGLTTTSAGKAAVFEAKHVNPFYYALQDVAARYQPQMQHQMMVCGVDFAVLSVFVGNLKWESVEIEAEPFWQAEMLEREIAFWRAVETGEPLPEWTPVEPPQTGPATRSVDMSASNAWGSNAADWLASREHAAIAKAAEKELRALVESDVQRAFGHGVEIKRDKANRLMIREMNHAAV